MACAKRERWCNDGPQQALASKSALRLFVSQNISSPIKNLCASRRTNCVYSYGVYVSFKERTLRGDRGIASLRRQ